MHILLQSCLQGNLDLAEVAAYTYNMEAKRGRICRKVLSQKFKIFQVI